MDEKPGYCPLHGWTEKCPRVMRLQADIDRMAGQNKRLKKALEWTRMHFEQQRIITGLAIDDKLCLDKIKQALKGE